ncbi:MAG TPA: PAS domain S-box protein [Trueperaceae bacterium]
MKDTANHETAGATEALLAGQKQVLEMLATGADLTDVLAALVQLIEVHSDGLLGSILVRRPACDQFYLGIAPSLPKSYVEALSQAPITPPYLGPCGRATHLGEEVATNDIATDERWSREWRDMVLDDGLRSCFSAPIFASNGTVLGSFGLYRRERGEAKPRDQELFAMATHLAGISIESKQAEQALRDSEARLQRILDIETAGIIYFDPAGDITQANDAFLRMGGYTREDVKEGRLRWHELTPPEWMPASRRAIEQLKTMGSTVPYEKEYYRKDGSRWWGLFAAKGLSETEGVEFILDITERKRSEAALREAHLQLEAALSAGGVMTWVWDIREDRMKGSESFARLFAVDPQRAAEGLPLRVFVDALHEDDRERVLQEVNRAIETGVPYAADYRVWNADGQLRWVSARGQVEYDAAGRAKMFPGALVDITERKQAEEARRRWEIERSLDAQLTAERQRVGRELHDGLRQQLVGLTMLSTTVSKKLQASASPEAEMMQEFVTLIGDANEQLRQFIDGLVPAKIEAGSLLAALERASSNIERWYGIGCVLHAGRTIKLGDDFANHLYHIAREAMTNAARHADASRIDVSLRADDDSVMLQVQDDGKGLPADYDKRGSMGMANMRRRAELIGAKLTIESKGGTTISCMLPLGESLPESPVLHT